MGNLYALAGIGATDVGGAADVVVDGPVVVVAVGIVGHLDGCETLVVAVDVMFTVGGTVVGRVVVHGGATVVQVCFLLQ